MKKKALEEFERLIVPPGKKISLAKDYDPGFTGDIVKKEAAMSLLQKGVRRLAELQDMLYAQDRHALLIVFQAMDAAGKDGTIKHVMSGVNPQGCQVFSFKAPSAEELDHDFLWRCAKALPERGRIGIFNCSYYEEVVAVRVRPEPLEAQKLPAGRRGRRFWQGRFASINAFEHHLDRNGTKVVKFFLHVSKEEQRRRFLARLDDPAKEWKWSPADLRTRARFDDHMAAYEEAITATSTAWAPGTSSPPTTSTSCAPWPPASEALDLSYPQITAEQRQAIAQARRELRAD